MSHDGDLPLHEMSVTALAAALRAGELSCVALTNALLTRIASLDPQLQAFRLVTTEHARRQAEAVDEALRAGEDRGPVHGIPYVAKDLFDVAGLPTTAGTRLLSANVAERNATAVTRLEAAGMVLLGKTNTVQLAYGGVGVNNDHGTPHNPWHADHYVPGGSSSGTGVAVAAGLAPAGLGTDTAGSVRVPAAMCGVTGLKTTRGQVSRAGVYPLSYSLDSVGPLARSVEDAALLYEALQGDDPEDPTTHGRPRHAVLDAMRDGAGSLRVAFAETVFWDDVDDEIELAVRAVDEALAEVGIRVGSKRFEVAAAAHALNERGLVIAAEAYAVNREFLEGCFEEMDPIVAHRMINGRDVTAHEHVRVMMEWSRLRAQAIEAMRDVDVLICPTTMRTARPVAEITTDLDTYADYNLRCLRNTTIGSLLGLCGLSVPCGFDAEGLPIGMMLYGKPFREHDILAVGHAFQQVTDWHRRAPDLDGMENPAPGSTTGHQGRNSASGS